ncbi:SDR family NAD(P)-dependent oxidoreductase [Gordonia sp. X0973]|uniref:SDR family NAD(P)-dependent oxidoreductase n=1 Tax=Gordonia sp. X0973 TaxID=2742602 RepID=UPI000F51E38D|nr:SDR family NAD(P)-dependent oxidoreductase [Gordonia sp. X0973]QKT07760.1 SDR family NAD(P)-dependent oxidoreductase [Gordonia sp. X0973]
MADTKTIVITGASDGIGAVAARELAGPEVTLIITGRSPDKLNAVAEETGATAFVADFARLDDVRALAEQINGAVDHIDVLLNNAGGTFEPNRLRTVDGHEPNFQINHLSPFLLTNLLKDKLSGALIVNTSSVGNLVGKVDLDDLDFEKRRAFQTRCYGTAKLENILFTRGIARRWADDGIVSVAVHPGPVASSFGRDSFFIGLLYRTPLKKYGTITVEKGAAPLVELARKGADPKLNGQYLERFKKGHENKQASDPTLIDGLWTRSAELTGL